MTFNRKTLSLLAFGGLLSVAVPAMANPERSPQDDREPMRQEMYKGSETEALPPPPTAPGNIDYNASNPEEERGNQTNH